MQSVNDESGQAKTFQTGECTLVIGALCDNRLLVTLAGHDLGQLGRAPFDELERRCGQATGIELFIDLHAARGATIEVSGSWAVWLRRNRARFSCVTMLTGSPFIHLSAKAVQRFSQLGERARLCSDPVAFAGALNAV
jgi:hypothetical protein